MTLNASGYFHHLKSCLNLGYYAVPMPNPGEVVLKEKIDVGGRKKELAIKLAFRGEALAIKLDKEIRRGHHAPLFHFLDDQGMPWSKRCDFVVFQRHANQIKVFCFEFKYQSVDAESVIAQLKSSENWCKTLNATVNIYTGQRKKIKLTKYLVTDCTEERAATYLDQSNEYLARDASIKHYFYRELNGMNLRDLDHAIVKTIG